MSVVIDAPRASALDRPGLDPVIAVALAAGRRAGERLTSTPLTPRQRAAVAAVMGGGR